ncbi:MAG: hypothetical protein K6G63_02210 [Eubacterium sp.]|nr:hypothetical protein [Eubacterium sp.]
MDSADINASIQQGDREITHIYFGNYWQTSSAKKEPIEWRVGGIRGNFACLEAAKSLEYMVYDDVWSSKSTWATSSCRRWLNNVFLYDAFNASERALLKEDSYRILKKQDLSTVYLAAIYEGIPIKATDYAMRKYPENSHYVWWITNNWIQSEGRKFAYSKFENTGGAGTFVGYCSKYEGNTLTIRNELFGIRPAIYMDISKGGWKPSRFKRKNSETNKYEYYKIEYADKQDDVGVETIDTEYINHMEEDSKAEVQSEWLEYKIKKPSVKITKKSRAKAIIRWKADDSTSYDLWYSTSKKFAKKKTKKIKLTKTKYIITKLKKKKKYYVKVRGKLKVDRISANGKWSKVKTLKRK